MRNQLRFWLDNVDSRLVLSLDYLTKVVVLSQIRKGKYII